MARSVTSCARWNGTAPPEALEEAEIEATLAKHWRQPLGRKNL
jgi:hypothetical protein